MRVLLFLFTLWGASPQAMLAQTPAPVAEQVAPQSGLPRRAAPPRTSRAYGHVFTAFAVAWALLFGYALSLGRRFGRLERDIQALEDGEPIP